MMAVGDAKGQLQAFLSVRLAVIENVDYPDSAMFVTEDTGRFVGFYNQSTQNLYAPVWNSGGASIIRFYKWKRAR